MEAEAKKFNLEEGFPNVLLIGNGLVRHLSKVNQTENKDWGRYILELAEDPETVGWKESYQDIPYGLLASVLAATKDSVRHESYKNTFETLCVEDDSVLKNVVSLEFDAILTTNYTYEIENCFCPGYSSFKDAKKRKNAYTIQRKSLGKGADSRYLLHTYNEMPGSPPIWHIHGEGRRKSSMVLTHDEYARLIHKLIEENRTNQNKYEEYRNEVAYKSWLDYFLMSNLYILGFGMDFAEFDIWWILNRRKREKSQTGNIYYYAPKDLSESKRFVLEKMDVTILTFEDIPSDNFDGLYQRATEDIKKRLSNIED